MSIEPSVTPGKGDSRRCRGRQSARDIACWLAVFALIAFATWPALAERRVALVIGNGGYKAVPSLANPPNDAKDMEQTLKSLGFTVTRGLDLDQAEMRRAIEDFGKEAATADVSLFYFGGHGLQVAGQNYLIPIDAELHALGDVEKRTVPLREVLDAQSKSPGIHLIFLDACRNNPVTGSAGLARIGNATGFLIAFSTEPGNVAYDGEGRNSPFAKALLGHIASPGVDISSMMIATRRDVMAATGGAQIPYEEGALTRQFYFAGESASDASPETLLWRLAGGNRDPSLLSLYLDRFPDGPHAMEARSLLPEVEKTGVAPSDAVGNVEQLLWTLARSERQARLVGLYLARYPTGAHATEANELLASLRAGEQASALPEAVCERLATHPNNSTASVKGVPLEDLARNSEAAIAACSEATAAHPEVAHYIALLARATAAAGRYEDAYKLYEKAADMYDTRAMVSLGLMLETGDHAPRNLKAAYVLYEKAAERGSADGAMDLAVALIEGRGIDKNVPRAYALLRKASESGSPRATYDLAYVTSEGRGGNPADAAGLFRKAGDDGYPEGYRAAAVLLDEGRGVPKDPKGAAENLLRGVSDDAGESLSDVAGKTQRWSAETIKVVQSRLKAAGYYSGPIDGRSGPGIEPALKQWRLLGDRAH